MTPERQILLQLGEMLRKKSEKGVRIAFMRGPDYKEEGDSILPELSKLLTFIEQTAMSEEQNFVLTKLSLE